MSNEATKVFSVQYTTAWVTQTNYLGIFSSLEKAKDAVERVVQKQSQIAGICAQVFEMKLDSGEAPKIVANYAESRRQGEKWEGR